MTDAASQTPVRLPGPTDRTFVVGSTGSGKSTFMAWLLSTMTSLDWRVRPVVIMDWKRDRLLNSLGAQDIDPRKKPPTKPGLYIARLNPPRQDFVDEFLNRVWEQEDFGLFFDETVDLKGSEAVERIYKQGRSKQIACIAGAQRPLGVPIVIRSEADFYSMFRLNDSDDRKEMRRYLGDVDVLKKFGKHCSIWYDTAEDRAVELSPVPSPAQIAARIRWLQKGGSQLRRAI